MSCSHPTPPSVEIRQNSLPEKFPVKFVSVSVPFTLCACPVCVTCAFNSAVPAETTMFVCTINVNNRGSEVFTATCKSALALAVS